MKRVRFTGSYLAVGVTALLVSFAVSAQAQAGLLYSASQNGGWYSWDTATGQQVVRGGAAVSLSVVVSGDRVYTAGYLNGRIELSGTDGSVVNQSAITPANGFRFLALSGNTLYTFGDGTVSTWNATTGASINPSLVTGLGDANALLVSGSSLYVGEFDTSKVSQWNATSGSLINGSFISGFKPTGFAVSGERLFVSNYESNSVGEYDLATGSTTNSAFITGVPTPKGLAISGTSLFVASCDTGSYIGKYDVISGSAINSQFIPYASSPNGLFIEAPEAVPEIDPAGLGSVLALLGGVLGLAERRRLKVA